MQSSKFVKHIRYDGYKKHIMSAEEAASYIIKPGMVLGVGGFTMAGYPKCGGCTR